MLKPLAYKGLNALFCALVPDFDFPAVVVVDICRFSCISSCASSIWWPKLDMRKRASFDTIIDFVLSISSRVTLSKRSKEEIVAG